MKAFRFLAVLVASAYVMAVTDARSGNARSEVKRQATYAEKTAACVRAAVIKANEMIDVTPGKSPEAIARELDASSQMKADGIQKCLTEQEAYFLGWFEPLDYVIEKCGARRTKALDQHPEDDAHSDLLNGAAVWRFIPLAANAPDGPFLRGQSEAMEHFRDKPLRDKCDALLAGYGPKGDRFPGLVEPIKAVRSGRL